MRRIDELTAEINEATLELQRIKDQMSKQFREIWKLQCRKDRGKDYDEERYESLMYNHKLLQMKRRQLITHIDYLNKEFFEILIWFLFCIQNFFVIFFNFVLYRKLFPYFFYFLLVYFQLLKDLYTSFYKYIYAQ